jgi:hypothetical protein
LELLAHVESEVADVGVASTVHDHVIPRIRSYFRQIGMCD